MSDLADVRAGERVLEIGTGSGYQAAVLAEMGARVWTIEIVATLAERATALLRELGYRTIETRVGDGFAGWPAQAPFDAIVVTAAPETVPEALLAQLAPGGRMVIPVGPAGDQRLLVIVRDAEGRTRTREALPVRFVPMVRGRAP
jgi:protein-L-isoaspartate(D-aspartate) O-methyltransferase